MTDPRPAPAHRLTAARRLFSWGMRPLRVLALMLASVLRVMGPQLRKLLRPLLRPMLGLLVWLGASTVVLGTIAWLVLQFAVLPRVNEWRSTVERHASKSLGVTVRIGSIHAQRDGLLPRVTLRELSVVDEAGKTTLLLPRIGARLSLRTLWPASLWRGELRLEELSVDSPQIDIRRNAEGQILVGGILLDTGQHTPADDQESAADWLFSQPEVSIRNGTLRWLDDARDAPPLVLSRVDLTLNNGPTLTGRRHDVDLQATPPRDWGARFKVQARLTQALLTTRLFGERPAGGFRGPSLTRPGDWHTWSGDIQLELPDTDTSRWPLYLDLPFEIQGGQGSLLATVAWNDGRIQGFNANLDLRNVSARLAPELEPVALTRIHGTLGASVESLANGRVLTKLHTQNLGFVASGGWVWPAGHIELSWEGRAAQHAPWSVLPDLGLDDIDGGEFVTEGLDLAALNQLAKSLPMSAKARARLSALKPAGRAEQVRLSFSGPLDQPTRYQAKGLLRGLQIAPGWGSTAAAVAPSASAAISTATSTATSTAPSTAISAAPTRTQPGQPTAVAAGASAAAAAASATPSAPAAEHPGVHKADVFFEATERGGQAQVSIRNGSLTFPGIFDEPTVAVRQLDAQLQWSIDPDAPQPKVEVHVRSATVSNDDLQGTLEASWQTGAAAGTGYGRVLPGLLKLKAKVSQGRAAAVVRYLPKTIAAEARHYVSAAVLSGDVANVTIQIEGDLAHVPARQNEPGTFLITGQVRNASLAYVPPNPAATNKPNGPSWPIFTDLNADLVFDRQGMSIRQAKARLGTVGSGKFELVNVEGRIPDLAHDATLVISGTGRGPLADLLSYINGSPINTFIAHALSTTTGEGHVEAGIALNLPLGHIKDSSVRGSVRLSNNSLRIGETAPPLSAAQGQINFTHRDVQLQLKAQALGSDLAFEGGSQADGSLRFSGSSRVTAAGLQRYAQAQASPVLERLAAKLQGQTTAKLSLGFELGQPSWIITSNLAGLAIDLPAPLNKRAEQVLAMRLQINPLAGASSSVAADPSAATRDVLRFDLGSVLQAQYLRDTSVSPARVLRGGIGIMQAAKLPAQGVDVQALLPQLDLDAWHQALKTTQHTTGIQPPAAGTAAPSADDNSPYAPSTLTLRARELRLGQRQFQAVKLSAARAGAAAAKIAAAGHPSPGTVWVAQLDSEQVNGQIDLVMNGHGAPGLGRINARLKRLVLPAESPSTAAGRLAEPSAVRPPEPEVPALSIVADDFQLGSTRLGRLELQAEQNLEVGAGSERPWRLTQLAITNPEASLNATGMWHPPAIAGGERRCEFDFVLDLRNSGALLTRLGQPLTLKGGKGRVDGKLAWSGSPFAPKPTALDGEVRIALNAGQFLKADPGAARLFSVLSLQSLPRRLMLDFRDIFGDGFAFDQIDGNVSVSQGKARTNNLRMRGVQALVLMEGEADLAAETQNLHVWVVPEINAGTASLAYAAINPAMGLGTFLAQVLLRKPLIEASTREMRITGAWADPKVETIARSASSKPPTQSSGNPVAATAQAAPAPSKPAEPKAAGSPASSASQVAKPAARKLPAAPKARPASAPSPKP